MQVCIELRQACTLARERRRKICGQARSNRAFSVVLRDCAILVSFQNSACHSSSAKYPLAAPSGGRLSPGAPIAIQRPTNERRLQRISSQRRSPMMHRSCPTRTVSFATVMSSSRKERKTKIHMVIANERTADGKSSLSQWTRPMQATRHASWFLNSNWSLLCRRNLIGSTHESATRDLTSGTTSDLLASSRSCCLQLPAIRVQPQAPSGIISSMPQLLGERSIARA